MPNQDAYDSALALAQLVFVRLLPAYTASTDSSNLPLMMSEPPALLAGLATPLPASITGDERAIDVNDVVAGGVDALDALQAKISKTWALGAE
jgi:metaxin